MPLPLVLIPIIASAVGAASKLGMAAYQNKMSKKVAKPRPTYNRPGEVQTAEGLAANAYNSAGDTRLEEQAIDNSAANAVYQLSNSGNNSATNMAMIAALQGSANQAKTQAVLGARTRKDELRGQYEQALNNSAQYSDKEFQVNKFEPYQNAALAAQQLKSAAGKNMEGGIKDAISVALNAASLGLTSKLNPMKLDTIAQGLKVAKDVSKVEGVVKAIAPEADKETLTKIVSTVAPLIGGMLNGITPLPKDNTANVGQGELKSTEGIGNFTPKINVGETAITPTPRPTTEITPADLPIISKELGVTEQVLNSAIKDRKQMNFLIDNIPDGNKIKQDLINVIGSGGNIELMQRYIKSLDPKVKYILSKLMPLLVTPENTGTDVNSLINTLIPNIQNK